MSVTILQGDCIERMRTLESQSVQTCVTSPPYFGLRSYLPNLHPFRWFEIGQEKTPQKYVDKLVAVFQEVKRVLRDDGTVWLNLGDSYFGGGNNRGNGSPLSGKQASNRGATGQCAEHQKNIGKIDGLKPKDLIGIPWSVAKALQQPFYSGKINNELDRVWLAATIDAEGSICGFHHTRKDDGSLRTGVHLTITNTNRMMLDNAYRIWPTSRQNHNNHGVGHHGKLDCWRWIAHDVDEKSALLQELYPYFVSKRKQALLAWNFLEMSRISKRLGKTSEAQPMKDKRSWIVHALTKLNALVDVDIPSWCKEPPTLFSDGWYLRSDIIWAKGNPMPESVTDRPTRSHEFIFLLTKNPRYYYNAEAIKEPPSPDLLKQIAEGYNGQATKDFANGMAQDASATKTRIINGYREKIDKQRGHERRHDGFNDRWDNLTREEQMACGSNKRDVWTVAPANYPEAHFATFPPDLIRPCILAGSKPGDTVLDPFGGSGTVGEVALEYGRKAILIELNPAYIPLIERRTNVTPGLPL